MRCRLRKLLFVLSLAPLLLVATGWIASYWNWGEIIHDRYCLHAGVKQHAIDELSTHEGGWYYVRTRSRLAEPDARPRPDHRRLAVTNERNDLIVPSSHPGWGRWDPWFAGFGRCELFATGRSPMTIVRVPCWATALVAAVPICPWLRRDLRRRRRTTRGWCLACGYDLRATPDRCPECGTPRVVAEPHEPLRWQQIGCAMSLVLCLVTIATWAASYWPCGSLARNVHIQTVQGDAASSRCGITAVDGAIYCTQRQSRTTSNHPEIPWPPDPRDDREYAYYSPSSGDLPRSWSHQCTGFAYERRGGPDPESVLRIPCWSLVLISAIAPAIWLGGRILRAREWRARSTALPSPRLPLQL